MYCFRFSDNIEIKIDVELDSKTLSMVSKHKEKKCPDWVYLKYKKCPNCRLLEERTEYCPVARNLLDIVDLFTGHNSYDNVKLSIYSQAREYSKETSLEDGISSLVGIYMVTSGCPVLDKLRPMVRYHLPFANVEETQYRAVAMYLVGQYLLYKSGKTPDWDLEKLYNLYSEVRIINKKFSSRLMDAILKDASINALVKLDCFAGYISYSIIDKEIFNDMKKYFSAFLEEE
ncbi:MAG: hypothetical protein JW871_07710 [Endomicrobiales bacterium]|nr:hypothetical protein [Endomicrobiales bacterium]